jgi:CRISPR/Cas system CMR subunit Cmr4 (Cas7 group RAMP superfamily)
MNLINDALGKRKNLLQIGGDATIGKGLCKVRLDCGASSKLSKENKQ